MARWEITLSQPAGATNALPPAVMRTFGEDGYKRSTRLSKVLNNTTIGGRGTIGGTTIAFTHEWELSIIDFEDTVLQLEALIGWQQKMLSDRLDGRLLLTDEFEYTMPMFGTHPKTLLGGSTLTVATGCTTGFGVFPVIIALPDQPKQHRGVKDGEFGKALSLIAVEVPT